MPQKSPETKKFVKPVQTANDIKKYREDLLDEALDETFPASDPPSMLEPAPNSERTGPTGKR
ncbi:hypothetical protein ROS1_56820 [Roseibium sp. ROS1]